MKTLREFYEAFEPYKQGHTPMDIPMDSPWIWCTPEGYYIGQGAEGFELDMHTETYFSDSLKELVELLWDGVVRPYLTCDEQDSDFQTRAHELCELIGTEDSLDDWVATASAEHPLYYKALYLVEQFNEFVG